MSDNKVNAAYRLMVIDIEEDKIILDEFCDVFLGAYAKNSEGGKRVVDAKGTSLVKSSYYGVAAACMAAEKIIEKNKKRIVKEILSDAGAGDIENVIDNVLGKEAGKNNGAEKGN